jgi:selenide,water dikinase
VRDLVAAGMVAGGTQRNHAFVSDSVDWGGLPEPEQLLLADAQTSGGLLISVASERASDLVDALEARRSLAAAVVGATRAGQAGEIAVR